MKKALIVLLITAMYTQEAYSELCGFGYSMTDLTKTGEMFSALSPDIPNMSLVTSETGSASETLDFVNLFNAHGKKPIISLINVIYEDGDGDCTDYGGGSPTGDGLDRRSDYQTRLQNFFAHDSRLSDADNISGISINEEANNFCVGTSDLQTVLDYIKNTLSGTYPDLATIPLVVGYGMSKGVSNAKALPSAFPADSDWIGFWDYWLWNPNDQLDSLNGSSDWDTRWSDFTSKLGSRKAIAAINSWCDSQHVTAGWTSACATLSPVEFPDNLYLHLTYEWILWAKAQSEIIALIGFTWADFNSSLGTESLDNFVVGIQKIAVQNIDTGGICTGLF